MALEDLSILLLAIVALGVLILAVLVATRRGKSASPDKALEITIIDRLNQMQNGVQDALAGAQREMVETRDQAQARSAKFELSLNDRITKLEKGIQESVAAAKKEVTDSKTALDKNAIELNKFMTGMGQTIQKLTAQQEVAERISTDLKFLLEGPKSRGTFGETILEELLERSLPRGIWHRQYPIDGRDAVDAAIVLKETIYPVDAKFPKEDYQRFLRAADDKERANAWKAHQGAVKKQIDSIARKYVKPEAGTAQFALMFIPSEGMYYDTIADADPFDQPNTLMEYAFEQHVVPVGPTTLFAFLQVIAKGQEGQRLVDSAKQLQAQLDRVRSSFDKFYGRYEETGKHITKAAEAYRVGDGHIQRFKDRVDGVLAFEFDGLTPLDTLREPEAELAEIPSVPTTRPETLTAVETRPEPEAATPVKAEPPTPVALRKGRAAFKVED